MRFISSSFLYDMVHIIRNIETDILKNNLRSNFNAILGCRMRKLDIPIPTMNKIKTNCS